MLRLRWKEFFAIRQPVQIRRWTDRREHESHSHDFHELVIITGGTGHHRSASGEAKIGVGDAILIPPGQWHAYEQCASLSGYDCCFHGMLLYGDIAWVTDDPILGPLLLNRSGADMRARIHADDLVVAEQVLGSLATIGEARNEDRLPALGALLYVLGVFARTLANVPPDVVPRRVAPAHRAAVERVLASVGKDLAREWSVAELAAIAGLPSAALTRAFRAVVGHGPMTHLSQHRIEAATTLLLTTDLPVAEVGARVGIYDANYFARLFRARLGLSPSSYRTRFSTP